MTSDHRTVGQHLRLNDSEWNAVERLKRRTPKPIRWRVDDDKQDEYNTALQGVMTVWNPTWGISEETYAMRGLLQHGHGHQKGHVAARRSPTQEKLKEELKRARTDEERWTVRQRRYDNRDKIKRENQRAENEYIFAHLGGGGWGKKDIARRTLATTQMMPYL